MAAPRGQQEIEPLNVAGKAAEMFLYRSDVVRGLYLHLSIHDRADCNIDKPCSPVPDMLAEAKVGADFTGVRLSG